MKNRKARAEEHNYIYSLVSRFHNGPLNFGHDRSFNFMPGNINDEDSPLFYRYFVYTSYGLRDRTFYGFKATRVFEIDKIHSSWFRVRQYVNELYEEKHKLEEQLFQGKEVGYTWYWPNTDSIRLNYVRIAQYSDDEGLYADRGVEEYPKTTEKLIDYVGVDPIELEKAQQIDRLGRKIHNWERMKYTLARFWEAILVAETEIRFPQWFSYNVPKNRPVFPLIVQYTYKGNIYFIGKEGRYNNSFSCNGLLPISKIETIELTQETAEFRKKYMPDMPDLEFISDRRKNRKIPQEKMNKRKDKT